jgi:hypothetical protein
MNRAALDAAVAREGKPLPNDNIRSGAAMSFEASDHWISKPMAQGEGRNI